MQIFDAAVSEKAKVEAKRLSQSVAGSAIATTLYHLTHTHIYIATLLHRFLINSVLHLLSPLYVRQSLHSLQVNNELLRDQNAGL